MQTITRNSEGRTRLDTKSSFAKREDRIRLEGAEISNNS